MPYEWTFTDYGEDAAKFQWPMYKDELVELQVQIEDAEEKGDDDTADDLKGEMSETLEDIAGEYLQHNPIPGASASEMREWDQAFRTEMYYLIDKEVD